MSRLLSLNSPLTFNDRCPSHIETSQLICSANQLTGFYVRGTLLVKGLKINTHSLLLTNLSSDFLSIILSNFNDLLTFGY